MESWELYRKGEAEKEVEKTFKNKDTDEKFKKKVKYGEKSETYKYCVGKLRQKFIKKLCSGTLKHTSSGRSNWITLSRIVLASLPKQN